MNSLYKAFYTGEAKEKINEIIINLVNYKDNHFATEEKYFDMFNYENSAEHKEEHQKLRKTTEKIYQKIQTGSAEAVGELMDFLEDWLVDHLENQDQKYVECFQKNGLK